MLILISEETNHPEFGPGATSCAEKMAVSETFQKLTSFQSLWYISLAWWTDRTMPEQTGPNIWTELAKTHTWGWGGAILFFSLSPQRNFGRNIELSRSRTSLSSGSSGVLASSKHWPSTSSSSSLWARLASAGHTKRQGIKDSREQCALRPVYYACTPLAAHGTLVLTSQVLASNFSFTAGTLPRTCFNNCCNNLVHLSNKNRGYWIKKWLIATMWST